MGPSVVVEVVVVVVASVVVAPVVVVASVVVVPVVVVPTVVATTVVVVPVVVVASVVVVVDGPFELEHPAVVATSPTTASLHAPPLSCRATQKKAPPLHANSPLL